MTDADSNSEKMKCLNPWDVQSKHIIIPCGKSEALCAGEKRWGALPPNVLYEVENGEHEMLESLGSTEQKTVSD